MVPAHWKDELVIVPHVLVILLGEEAISVPNPVAVDTLMGLTFRIRLEMCCAHILRM